MAAEIHRPSRLPSFGLLPQQQPIELCGHAIDSSLAILILSGVCCCCRMRCKSRTRPGLEVQKNRTEGSNPSPSATQSALQRNPTCNSWEIARIDRNCIRHCSAPWWWTKQGLNLHLRVRPWASPAMFAYTTGPNQHVLPLQSFRPQLEIHLAEVTTPDTVLDGHVTLIAFAINFLTTISKWRVASSKQLVRRHALILVLIQNLCGKLLHESRKLFPAISHFNASTMCFPREVR
jgi:hypothetical protein